MQSHIVPERKAHLYSKDVRLLKLNVSLSNVTCIIFNILVFTIQNQYLITIPNETPKITKTDFILRCSTFEAQLILFVFAI